MEPNVEVCGKYRMVEESVASDEAMEIIVVLAGLIAPLADVETETAVWFVLASVDVTTVGITSVVNVTADI